MVSPQLVRAAGCVVWREGGGQREDGGQREVLLVHRPRYDDWSFPKGKLDPDEGDRAAALREVEEETGLQVVLGPKLPDQHYTVSGGQPKVVAYWAAQPAPTATASAFEPNDEVDDLRWFTLEQAHRKLSYRRDVGQLEAFEESCFLSTPLLVVRHAHARDRKTWKSDDSERPLADDGESQALALVDVLKAYGVTKVVSSDSVRCVDTVLPFVNASQGTELRLEGCLSEKGAQAKPDKLTEAVQGALSEQHRVALCSHRPVLPDIFKALGVDPVWFDPAGVVVIHRRDGMVLDVEHIA